MLFDSQPAIQSDLYILTGFNEKPALYTAIFNTLAQELPVLYTKPDVSAEEHILPVHVFMPHCLSIQNVLNLHG
ncbi:MAG: hypothetical protein ACNA8K_05170 [Cyclonatronaceae bacterium]